MSKVIKGIKKVFKPVLKVVKKVAPIILAAAAVYFTAGAALALPGAAVGVPGAASAISGAMGLTAGSTLSGVVTGALTQASYGSLAGGVISKASGGSFSDGARQGAMVGAVTGGVTGGVGAARTAANAATQTGGVVPGNAAGIQPFPPEVVANANPSTVSGQQAGRGLFSKTAGWLERNQTLAGNMVSGLGQGLMASADSDAAGKSEMAILRERDRLTSEKYAGVDPGRNYNSMNRGTSTMTPAQRFNPGSFRYEYNSQTGRIEQVPRA